MAFEDISKKIDVLHNHIETFHESLVNKEEEDTVKVLNAIDQSVHEFSKVNMPGTQDALERLEGRLEAIKKKVIKKEPIRKDELLSLSDNVRIIKMISASTIHKENEPNPPVK
jgi:hypothetical protein